MSEKIAIIDACKTFALANPGLTTVIVIAAVFTVGAVYVVREYINKDSKNKDEDRDVDNNRRGKIRKS
jgi:hypothetical protein